MSTNRHLLHPEAFWQDISPAGTFETPPPGGYQHFYPANFPDGRQIALPIRERDGGRHALASLILNQASFAVVDAFAEALAVQAASFAPDIVVGLPTLGLTLAAETARKLGHQRYVPLGTSRKFWYQDDLSVPLSSITSPDQSKRLYMDPRMLPLLAGKRILLVDDVISTGSSIGAACALLELCKFDVTVIGAAMLQTNRWKGKLAALQPKLPQRVIGVISSPPLVRKNDTGWIAA